MRSRKWSEDTEHWGSQRQEVDEGQMSMSGATGKSNQNRVRINCFTEVLVDTK